MGSLSRRAVLASGVGAALLARGVPAASAASPAPRIHPRQEWADGLKPLRAMKSEEPGDVRFLLVHHSESPNTDRPGGTPERLRSFFRFHTSAEKGWPDVAYNFFVDRFGEVWEGRSGSLSAPVRGDATGGSQGFAQLACFVGDHSHQPPSAAAMTAMTELLAWLAVRFAIDLSPASRITFTSRGSNRWPAGQQVSTDPIAGHRDMSQTECPGEALYPLIRSTLLPGARSLVGAARSPVPVPSPSTSATAEARTAPPAANSPVPVSGRPTPAGEQSPVATAEGSNNGLGTPATIALGATAAAAVGAGVVALTRAAR